MLRMLEKPDKLLKLEALTARFPTNHEKYELVSNNYAKVKAGYKGEKALDYYLRNLPEKRFFIIRDIRLFYKGQYFQIDTLILCSNYFIIIEVKNIAGTLFFDTNFKQLIRTINDKEEALPDPITQVQRHYTLFTLWLKQEKITPPPILTLIVNSNPYTLLKASQSQISNHVIHLSSLPFKMDSIDKHHLEEKIALKELKKLSRLIIRSHCPIELDVLSYFNIKREDIKSGVQCPSCSHIPMSRKRGYWHCPNCLKTSKNAHIQALIDYALLIEKEITNKKFCEFVHIKSDTVAKKLLNSLNLSFSGENRGRKYLLSEFLRYSIRS